MSGGFDMMKKICDKMSLITELGNVIDMAEPGNVLTNDESQYVRLVLVWAMMRINSETTKSNDVLHH